MLAYFQRYPEAVVAVGIALSSATLVGASWVERSPSVVKWRMKRDLLNSQFYESNSQFSKFQHILNVGEKPFHRPDLLKNLVQTMQGCLDSDRRILIVGAVSGCGKSVFWERVLSMRPLSSDAVAPTHDPEALELHRAWGGFAGPTRVVNLLQCPSIEAFESQVVKVFHPKPWLPNFTFRAEPTAFSTLELMKTVLENREFEKNPLIVYVEDANRFPRFADSNMDLIVDFFDAFQLNTLIVGNSSSVLAFRKFQTLSHLGARSRRYFFPTLEPSDPQLIEFARHSGHLYASNPPATLAIADAVASERLAMWGGNLLLLKDTTSTVPIQTWVKNKLATALSVYGISESSHHFELIAEKSKEDRSRMLSLRRQLLQRLVDEGGKVSVDSLSRDMEEFDVHLQLAALDVVSFSTEYDAQRKAVVEYVIPYYPYVLTAFREMSNSPASKTL